MSKRIKQRILIALLCCVIMPWNAQASQDIIIRATDGGILSGDISCTNLDGWFYFNMDDTLFRYQPAFGAEVVLESEISDLKLVSAYQDSLYLASFHNGLSVYCLSEMGKPVQLCFTSYNDLFETLPGGQDAGYFLKDMVVISSDIYMLFTSYDAVPPILVYWDIERSVMQRTNYQGIRAIELYNQDTLIMLTDYNELQLLADTTVVNTIGELGSEPVSAFSYQSDGEFLYFIQNGNLCQWDQRTGTTVLEKLRSQGVESDFTMSIGGKGDALLTSPTGVYYFAPGVLQSSAILTCKGSAPSVLRVGFEDATESVINLIGKSVVTANDYMTCVLSRDKSFDVAVIMSSLGYLPTAEKKGYCGSLSSCIEAESVADRLYPQIVDYLCQDGTLRAMPVSANLSCLCVNRNALESMGITTDDLPITVEDWFGWIASWNESFGDVGISIRPVDTLSRTMRHYMFSFLINTYLDYCALNEVPITFDNCGFPELLHTIEANQQAYEQLDAFDPQLVDDVQFVFTTGNPLDANSLAEGWIAWPLKLSIDAAPTFSLQITTVVINPNTENYELAETFIDYCAKNLPPQTQLLLCADWMEPIPNRKYQRDKENIIRKINEIQELETQDDVNRTDELYLLQLQLTAIEAYRWDVSPASVDWYHNISDQVTISGANGFTYAVSDQLSEITESFGVGHASAESTLNNLQRMASMYLQENR